MALVEAVSWDITLGVASTGLGQLILGKTSDSEGDVPEAIDHTGLIVFGNLYEYGDEGILKTVLQEGAPVKSRYPAYSLRSREPMGETTKTQEEFEAWVEEQNAGDFQGSNYDLVTRSCVVWAQRGAEFLGVPYPENWDKIAKWAARNEGFTSIVGKTGLAARYVQHKAEEYIENPEKFKEKAKKIYRKLRRKKRAAGAQGNASETNGDDDGDGDGDEEDDDDDDYDDDSDGNKEQTEDEHKIAQEIGALAVVE